MRKFEDPGEEYPMWYRNQAYLNWVATEQKPLSLRLRVALSVFLIYILPTFWVGFLAIALIGTLMKGCQ